MEASNHTTRQGTNSAAWFRSYALDLATDAEVATGSTWDTMYPEPTDDALFLRFTDGAPKDITVMDVAGRQVASQTSVTTSTHFLPLGQMAKGVYWVRVTDGKNMKAKKLIIH